MPVLTSIDMLRALRAEGNPVNVAFVTSEIDPTMRDSAIEAGALFAVIEPCTMEAIEAALQPLLS